MNENEKVIPLNSSFEEFEENKLEKFFLSIFNYRNHIAVGLLITFLSVFVFAKFMPSKINQVEEYKQANASIEKWNETKEINQQLMQNLMAVASKHPELKSRFQHEMHQRFISFSRAKEITKEIATSLANNSILNQNYILFSQASLLISNEEHEEALKKTISLHEQMKNDQEMKDVNYHKLFAFNSLRMVSLYQKLGNLEGELDSLKALRQLITSEDASIKEFIAHFDQNGVSLLDYIKNRETTLLGS